MCFSHVSCLEDCTITDDYYIKDVSIFLGNRTLADTFIIETDPDAVDGTILGFMQPEPYNGGTEYPQLTLLLDSLKAQMA